MSLTWLNNFGLFIGIKPIWPAYYQYLILVFSSYSYTNIICKDLTATDYLKHHLKIRWKNNPEIKSKDWRLKWRKHRRSGSIRHTQTTQVYGELSAKTRKISKNITKTIYTYRKRSNQQQVNKAGRGALLAATIAIIIHHLPHKSAGKLNNYNPLCVGTGERGYRDWDIGKRRCMRGLI